MATPNLTITLLAVGVFVFLLTTPDLNSVTSTPCNADCSTPFTPGAVAYWSMTAETKGSDLSGNRNHATFVGLTHTDSPTGDPSGAVHFHGNTNSFAWVAKSSSIEIGKYPGFSVCGFIRFSIDQPNVPLIDSRNIQYGWGLFSFPAQNLDLDLAIGRSSNTDAVFRDMNFTTGSWRFFGASYDKATGRVTGFMDGKRGERQLDKNIASETSTTSRLALGRSYLPGRKFYNGDMSCIMLFKVSLTADDFERIWRFCSTTRTTQITLPNITITDITATGATASWIKSPGTFSGNSITIERRQSKSDQETAHPQSLPSTVVLPTVNLVNLVPGASYRVHVWHMQGAIKGRAISSHWFDTNPAPVEPVSITFSMITTTSATVAWSSATGYFDGYTVYITPTSEGAKVEPSTVPRGRVRSSLHNLTPGSFYTIAIRTIIGSRMSSPSIKSFQTKDRFPWETTVTSNTSLPSTGSRQLPYPPNPQSSSGSIAAAGLALAVICLLVMVVFIAFIFIQIRRKSTLSSGNGAGMHFSRDNRGFQSDDPSQSNGPNNANYDAYAVPDRSQIGENTPDPLYENVTSSHYEQLSVQRIGN